MPEAVGAFLAAAGLILLTAAVKPLGRLVEKLPVAVAAAMLAGILLRFVLEVFVQAGVAPALVLPLVLLFLAIRTVSPSWAVILVLVAGILLARFLGLAEGMTLALRLTEPVFVRPAFEAGAIVGLGLPLYLVTMAGQNLPGYAVLRTFGYTPPTRPILLVTGLAAAATAPFGAHMTNLSAITAAICNGPDAHPDPKQRWLTGPFYALGYVFLAVFAASFVALFASLPPAPDRGHRRPGADLAARRCRRRRVEGGNHPFRRHRHPGGDRVGRFPARYRLGLLGPDSRPDGARAGPPEGQGEGQGESPVDEAGRNGGLTPIQSRTPSPPLRR